MDSPPPKKVKQSLFPPPTETMFLAVAGGDTWIGCGLFGSSSRMVPSQMSGMTRSIRPSRPLPRSPPLFPAGTNTM